MRTIPARTKTLTLTEAAVLCLLSVEGEKSGYELLKQATRSVGHVWAPAKSQLYAVLPRLARDGLARTRTVVQNDRPDKQLYAITASGKHALTSWLETVDPEDVSRRTATASTRRSRRTTRSPSGTRTAGTTTTTD